MALQYSVYDISTNASSNLAFTGTKDEVIDFLKTFVPADADNADYIVTVSAHMANSFFTSTDSAVINDIYDKAKKI